VFFHLTSGNLLISVAVVIGLVLVLAGLSWAIGWFVSHRD
jgi:hypothetical protein